MDSVVLVEIEKGGSGRKQPGRVIGPFDTREEAEEYLMDTPGEWWVLPLDKPVYDDNV